MIDEELIQGIDDLHALACGTLRDLLRLIALGDTHQVWRDRGARDMAHWVAMRNDVSGWKARRWIAAAHALEALPRLSQALPRGELGIDKAVELCRFATPETEARLIRWAQTVSCAAIRQRGDRESRQSIAEVRKAEEARSLTRWYYDEGRRYAMYLDGPAACGAVMDKAVDRMLSELPVMPGEEDDHHIDARRADALVALASARLAADADADRATVVAHAPLQTLAGGTGGAEVEGGGVLHPETTRRLLCTSRVQAVVADRSGNPLQLGRLTRVPSAAMVRQLRWRDRECRFPGCGARRFTRAHHIVWWDRGGRTDLDNLVLICFFHYRLVHEHGWSLRRDPTGMVHWFRPDGIRNRAGPAPPVDDGDRRSPADLNRPALVIA